MVWALTAAHLEPHGPWTELAEVLAAAFLSIVSALGPLLEIVLMLYMAHGLHLRIPQVAIVNFGELSDLGLKRGLRDCICSSAFAARSSALLATLG